MAKQSAYLKRLLAKNSEQQNLKEKGFIANESRIQAEADLLALRRQLSQEEQNLENLRTKEGEYSLTTVIEKMLEIEDVKQAIKLAETEFQNEFS